MERERIMPTSSGRPWHVYLLRCCDGKFYTGIAPDVEERVAEHQSGRGADFTKRRLPVVLVYTERHPSMSAACSREKKIKKWGRRKKQQLIDGWTGC